MRAGIFGSIVAGAVALGVTACGTSTNNAAVTTTTNAPSTTAVVTQVTTTTTVKTVTAHAKKAKPKPKTAPAPASTTTSAPAPAPAPAGPIMPNVVGKDLDSATGELDSKGIQYALDSDGKHVLLKFDWGVCSTSPAAGQPVTGTVVLTLGHFTCGA
jgi:hypothetical protein